MESKHTSAGGFGSKAGSKDGSDEKELVSPRARAANAEPKSFHHQSIGSKADSKSHKQAAIEAEEEEEADREFEALKLKPNEGTAMISTNPTARKIANGFRINYMNMRDASTGKLVWESDRFKHDKFDGEMEESIPKSILSCRAVSREINFTSMETINRFRIEQRVFFQGQVIEEWLFYFGYVICGSTNNWQQVIEAAPRDEMIPAEVLSGKVTFETAFYDDDLFLCKNLVRIYYV